MNEEFEKWYATEGAKLQSDPNINYWSQIVKAAFLAGAAAQRKLDVEVAWRYLLDYYGRAAADKVAAVIMEGGE